MTIATDDHSLCWSYVCYLSMDLLIINLRNKASVGVTAELKIPVRALKQSKHA